MLLIDFNNIGTETKFYLWYVFLDGFETVISERETTLFDPELDLTTDKSKKHTYVVEFDDIGISEEETV